MRQKEVSEAALLRILKLGSPGYSSGQVISAALGISRTAVWKHIKALRAMGFAIKAVPSKGYMLDTGRLPFNGVEVSSTLSTAIVGRKIHFHETLDSTSTRAFELARAGEAEGAVVMAETQTGGKGRVGRRWESPAGVNLYASVILRPDVAPHRAHELTFMAAVAVAEAVASLIGARPVVKWPNDILIDGRKAAGILLEMSSETDRVNFVVAGIGLNVNALRQTYSDAVRDRAISLSEKTGAPLDRAEAARRVFTSIDKWYKIYLKKGFPFVLDEWRGYFTSVGAGVRVVSFGKTIEGVCAGVDADGALLLKRASGIVERIVAGDVETVGKDSG